jgi:four helix bundle protein
MRPPARFEDIPAWQKAMELAIEIRRLLPLFEREEEPLAQELARSSVAVPSRIARGHGMGTRKGWQHGLSAASGAAARTEAALTLGIQLGFFAGDDAMPSLRLVRAVSQMLNDMLEELSAG